MSDPTNSRHSNATTPHQRPPLNPTLSTPPSHTTPPPPLEPFSPLFPSPFPQSPYQLAADAQRTPTCSRDEVAEMLAQTEHRLHAMYTNQHRELAAQHHNSMEHIIHQLHLFTNHHFSSPTTPINPLPTSPPPPSTYPPRPGLPPPSTPYQRPPNPLGGQRPPTPRIDFPRFSGGDPTSWISKVERYFIYHAVPYTDQLIMASIHLEGSADIL